MEHARRIVSLLPAGTEWLAALGLGDAVVGVSHECDYPEDTVRDRPRVTRARIESTASSAEIDRRVRELRARGEDLYELDVAALERLAPDLIVTQAQCSVCAVSEDEVRRAAATLRAPARVVAFSGASLEGVLADVDALARAAGVPEAAVAARDLFAGGLERLRAAVENRGFLPGARHAPPRLVHLEWGDPPMAAASWIPELVEAAGFECFRAAPDARKSVRVSWEAIARFDPDVIVLAPCGFGVERAESEARALLDDPAVADSLRATSAWTNGWIFAACGSQFFNRPGPRLLDSAQILGALHGASVGVGAEAFVDFVRQIGTPPVPVQRTRSGRWSVQALTEPETPDVRLPGTALPPPPRSRELEAALVAARRAGAITLRHFGHPAFELKADHSLVTAADREAELAVRSTLAEMTPEIPVLGEETATDEDVRRLVDRDAWVVDPIDGTSSFTAGLPTFAVSIGLLRKGVPVLGVLYVPRTDETYACDLEGPAFYGARPARGALTPDTVDERAYFCVPSDGHHLFDVRFPGKMRSLGSTALHVALVARGSALAAVLKPYVWDVAAVGAILRRAGGDLFELATGEPLDYARWVGEGAKTRALIACAPSSLPVLRTLVRRKR
jgi:iron complex transport system substrate-binding protein